MLDSLLNDFCRIASPLPDARTGSSKRYAISDGASCALAGFFFQSPSFLDFQRSVHVESARSNCHSLFGTSMIPSDGQIGNLLDGHDPEHFSDLVQIQIILTENGHLFLN